MRRRSPIKPFVALAATLAAASLLAACGTTDVTAPPPPATATPYSLTATPWPNGTVGQYGLRIDPKLLALLPKYVSGIPLTESPDSESQAMTDPNLPKSFDGYAAAGVGEITDTDWLVVTIGHLTAAGQGPDWYPSWRDDYAAGACSQAEGIANTSNVPIADWNVDVTTCNGGVIVYSMELDAEHVLSMYDLGPRRLGRQLIENLP
jgi:hypothetical protein